ncbi:hypothetical protein cypCar_00032995, partial [Cyprinus carpio]
PPKLVFMKAFKNRSIAEVYQCEADANPAATHFSWHSTPQTIPNDAIKTQGNKLYFLKLTSDLDGLYTCEASNEYGTGIGSLYWKKGEKTEDDHSEFFMPDVISYFLSFIKVPLGKLRK